MPNVRDYIRVPKEYIVDPVVPSVQLSNYTCGPAIGQCVLAKYGHDASQDDIAEQMGTNEWGTNVEGLVRGLVWYGLRVNHFTGSMEGLYDAVLRGNSAILCIYAYGFTHWVALVGQSRRNWFFADPSAENGLGFVSKQDFPSRWYNRLAVVISGTPRRNSLTTVPVQRIPK